MTRSMSWLWVLGSEVEREKSRAHCCITVELAFGLGVGVRMVGVLSCEGGQFVSDPTGPDRSGPMERLAMLLMVPAVRGAVGVVLSPLLIG